jgi:hypothetical protein
LKGAVIGAERAGLKGLSAATFGFSSTERGIELVVEASS